MKLLVALLQIPVYCSMSFALSWDRPPCGSGMTPQEAFDRATAVFSGKVLAIERRYRVTEAGTRLPSDEVRIEVDKSWKLVNRRHVTIVTTTTVPGICGSFAQGEIYLVYADQLNDTFLVSSASRTNRLADAGEDLKVLGEERVQLQSGEFRTHYVVVYGIAACLGLALIVGLFLYRINKKPFRAV